MKPLHYVKKYKLNKGTNFNHKEFLSDLTMDFVALLEVGKATENIKGFENAVRAIRMKFDGISNKTAGILPEKLWSYFFATVIAKMREELFPDVMAARKAQSDKRKAEYEERKRWREEEESFFDNWFKRALFSSILFGSSVPTEELAVLGLDDSAQEDDIKKAYKKLAMKHHPDKGGKHAKFLEVTEAKNKCLAWASNK